MIAELTIEHFRGFYSRRTIAFAAPNGTTGSGLTVLVGPNNSGKTTVVDSLRFLSKDAAPIEMEQRHEGKKVYISARLISNEVKTLTNPDLGATTVIEGNPRSFALQHIRHVPSRRAWSAYTSHGQMQEGQYWSNLSLHRQNSDDFFVARLASFSLDEKAKYHQSLQQLVPQLRDWHVDLSRGQLCIQYITTTGAKHSADLFGDGMASLFRIALAVHDTMQSSTSLIQTIIIDEPELSLHPQAQKRLASFLSSTAKTRQVVLTTHSPYFINWEDLVNGARVYRLGERCDGIDARALIPATISALANLMSDWQKPHLLDPVAREVFFADEVIFFEGQEDIGLLRRFAKSKGIEFSEAFGYGAGGAGNIKHFLRMAAELGVAACAIYDGDKLADKEEASGLFPKAFVEILPTPDIRDKMQSDGSNRETNVVEKLGLFDTKGNIKAEYEDFLVDLMKRIRSHFDKHAGVSQGEVAGVARTAD